MRSAFVLTAAVILGAGPAAAKDEAGPAVEVRLKSVTDLLAYVEYVGRIAGQDEQAKQLTALVKAFTNEKGLGGIDPDRPFGVYAMVTRNVVDSPVVAMIPVADEETILGLLRVQLSLDPKKGDDGVYEVKAPKIPAPVFFRFAKKYAFVTLREKKALSDAALIDPKTFFTASDPAVLSVAVHIDRVPADVRKAVFGQFELQLNQAKEKKDPDDTPAQHKLKGLFLDGLAGAVNSFLTDGKTLTTRLLIRPKDDELAIDVSATAADGSRLAKSFRSAAERTGLAPTAANVPNPVFAAAANFGLPASLVERLGPVVDDLITEAIEASKPDDRAPREKILDALRPTLKSGQFEAGLALTGSAEGKPYRLVAAVKTKDGTGIEKVAKELVPFIPGDKLKAEFDSAKVGGNALHKFTGQDPDLKKFFGTETVWAVTGDDLFVLSFESEPDGAKRVASGSPATGPILHAQFAAAAAAFAVEDKLTKTKLQGLVDDAFDKTSPRGHDTVELSVTGGDKLTIAFSAKGRALKLLAAMDRAKKQGD